MQIRLLALARNIPRHKQGVYANILTRSSNITCYTPRIYIGGASGPYGSQSQGLRANIRFHQARKGNVKTSSNLHEKFLFAKEWLANWAPLVGFRSMVDRELVKLAQTVMVLMFQSSHASSYTACRPPALFNVPQQWGLNETGPLHFDNIATYNRLNDTMDADDIKRIRNRQSANSLISAGSKKQKRNERLKKGGSIHINVHRAGEKIKRFFITPMTTADGCHIDLTIPIELAFRYQLQDVHTVQMLLDLNAADHPKAYASRAARSTLARQLGILITGSSPGGRTGGRKFKIWLKSQRQEGIRHAEILIGRISRQKSTQIQDPGERDVITSVQGNDTTFNPTCAAINIWQPGPSIVQNANDQTHFPSKPWNFTSIIHELVCGLRFEVLHQDMTTTPTVLNFFKMHSTDSITTILTKSIRRPVVNMILSSEEFSASKSVKVAHLMILAHKFNRLLAIGGDIRDRSQGVYANIVTSGDPTYFKIYVGSGATVSTRKKINGLRRRIQEHLSSVRCSTSRPQSGQIHSREVYKEGSHCNFVVLVQFPEPVDPPLVHIAEAIMVILFASWDRNPVFRRLRPKSLQPCLAWGLNNANPLNYGVCDGTSPTSRQRMSLNGQKRAKARMGASVAKAKEGGPVRVTTQRLSPSYWDFKFKICGETIHIPSNQGQTVGIHKQRTIYVKCEVASEQHKSPYANKAEAGDISKKLGVCIMSGADPHASRVKGFQIWLQCNSKKAVSRAKRLIVLLEHHS